MSAAVSIASRILLAVVLIASAVSKIASSLHGGHTKVQALETIALDGPVGSTIVSLVELVLALLVLSKYRRLGVLMNALFCATAGTVITIMKVRGLDVERCGCFGGIRVTFASHIMILENLLCLCITALNRVRIKMKSDIEIA